MSQSPSFRIDGLQQVSQPTEDLDVSVAFYRDVLGLRLIGQFDPPGIAFFDLGGVRLFLERGGASSVLYLRVPDIHAAYESLRARGVAFEDEPHVIFRDDQGQFGPAGESEWMVFFRDPSRNLLALTARATDG